MKTQGTEKSSPDDRFWRAEDMLHVLSTYWSVASNKNDSPVALINRYFNSLAEHATESMSMRCIRQANLNRDPETNEELPLDKIPNHDFIRRIGFGGFGEVWLARQVVTEHFRACKLISAAHAVELGGLKWLKQRSASHPNLFPIEEVGIADGWIYCLMPLAENAHEHADTDLYNPYQSMTLQWLLQRQWRLPNDDAVSIGKELASGLTCLHERGLTHGDIKPSNILRIDGRWAISDYGLLTTSANAIAHGHTPNYTPPEGPGTQAADVYALGVVLMMLITGNGPRSLDELKVCSRNKLIRDGINPKWKQVINKLTDHSPNQRPKAHEIGELLDWLGPDGRSRSLRKRVKLGALITLGPTLIIATLLIANGFAKSYSMGKQDEEGKWLFNDRFRGVNIAVDHFNKMPVILMPQIATADDYTLAITDSGQVVAWGSNEHGTCDVPKGIINPVRISAGTYTAMALQADGRVVQWGHTEYLDNVARVPDNIPPAIGIENFISANAFILLPDGTVQGWGENFECQKKKRDDSGVLHFPADLHDVARISGGNAHWIAQLYDGSIRGFGCNFSNQIAFPDNLPRVIDFGAAESWSLLLYENGTMESFGVGAGDTLSAPGTSHAIDIAVGKYCGIALDAGFRAVQYWGKIGTDKALPYKHLGDVVSVFAGGDTVGVVHPDGKVTMWGDNTEGKCDPPEDLRIRLTDPDIDRNGIPDWADILKSQYADSNAENNTIQSDMAP